MEGFLGPTQTPIKDLSVIGSESNSIHVQWDLHNRNSINGFKVWYQHQGSPRIVKSQLLQTDIQDYKIRDLDANTQYKVCVEVYRANFTSEPISTCIDAMTSNWHVPVSIGSSIGALLALIIIVVIVLVARLRGNKTHRKMIVNGDVGKSFFSSSETEYSQRFNDYELSEMSGTGAEESYSCPGENQYDIMFRDQYVRVQDHLTTEEYVYPKRSPNSNRVHWHGVHKDPDFENSPHNREDTCNPIQNGDLNKYADMSLQEQSQGTRTDAEFNPVCMSHDSHMTKSQPIKGILVQSNANVGIFIPDDDNFVSDQVAEDTVAADTENGRTHNSVPLVSNTGTPNANGHAHNQDKSSTHTIKRHVSAPGCVERASIQPLTEEEL